MPIQNINQSTPVAHHHHHQQQQQQHVPSCFSKSHDDQPKNPQKQAETRKRKQAPEKERMMPRDRLKRHRLEVSSSDRLCIPDIWGQEAFLKDWIHDSAAFDASLVAATIANARDSLMEECTRTRRTSSSSSTNK